MKKCFFLILAVCMILSLSVGIQAREIPVADSGYFKVAVVTGTIEDGYAVDDTVIFGVRFSRTSEDSGELFSENGQLRIQDIQPGWVFEDIVTEKPAQWIDPVTLPYTLTEQDCREGVLFRFMLTPDEPDEPDDEDPDEPDGPLEPVAPEEPEMGSRGESGRLLFGEDGKVARGGGSCGMLKGSREIPAEGILLNSLLAKSPLENAVMETAEAAKRASSAARQAVEENSGEPLQVMVPLGNTETVTPELINTVQTAVNEVTEKVKDNALPVKTILLADTVTEEGVAARMYIDAAEAQKNNALISTRIDIDAKSDLNQAIQGRFARHFKNQVVTAAFAQRGSFGMEISVAIKTDLSCLNRDALLFYSYDSGTNRYFRLTTGYIIDRNGYLHLNTSAGDSLIITDALLTPK